MRGDVLAVVGAQYGSEGKGVIVNEIADEFDVHVRVGGPNAGHSFYHKNELYKMQVIPCGWTNRNATLILGRGMVLDIGQLMKELAIIEKVDPTIWDRLKIDAKTGVLLPEHHDSEGGVNGEMHKRIGSTGEGVGAARRARINRDPSHFYHFGDVAHVQELEALMLQNTPEFIRAQLEFGRNVLLEGTQGSGLSLIHGPWPYVTSADTNAAQMAADVGIPPRFVNRTLLVMRTMPIRVAGNSGPLKDETTWYEVSRKLGKSVEERTTVTRKTRRVGEWDEALICSAVTLNAPTEIAITFLDYLAPEDEGKTEYGQLSERSQSFIHYVENLTGATVKYVGTGGPQWNVIRAG